MFIFVLNFAYVSNLRKGKKGQETLFAFLRKQ